MIHLKLLSGCPFPPATKYPAMIPPKWSFLYIHDAFKSRNLAERKCVRGTLSIYLSRVWVICVEDARWPCCYSKMLELRKGNTEMSTTGEAHSSHSMSVLFSPRKPAGQCPLSTRKAGRATTDPFLNNTTWWIKQPINQTSLQLNVYYSNWTIRINPFYVP